MTQWSAFVGFTGVVLTGFLLLARLSQRVVDDAGDRPVAGAGPVTPDADARRRSAALGPAEADAETASDAAESDEAESDEMETDEAVSDAAETGETVTDERETDESPVTDETSVTDASAAIDGSTATDTLATENPLTRGGEFEATRESTEATASPESNPTMSPGALLANVALTQGLFGGLLAAAAWYFGVPGSALGLSGGAVRGPAALAVGVGFGVALWVGNEFATAFADEVGAAYDEGLRAMLAPDDARGWLLLLGATLPVIALVEEFLFRAAAIGAASTAFGGAWALAVVSSVAFALGHGAQGRVGIVVTGALGFALAAGFVLTESFLVVVVAHYLVNALEFALHEGVGLPDPVWS